MNSAPKNLSRADRLLGTAPEPNLSSWGWPAAEDLGRAVSTKVIRRASLIAVLCLGLMLMVAL